MAKHSSVAEIKMHVIAHHQHKWTVRQTCYAFSRKTVTPQPAVTCIESFVLHAMIDFYTENATYNNR